jgi:hypothetical protein
MTLFLFPTENLNFAEISVILKCIVHGKQAVKITDRHTDV